MPALDTLFTVTFRLLYGSDQLLPAGIGASLKPAVPVVKSSRCESLPVVVSSKWTSAPRKADGSRREL